MNPRGRHEVRHSSRTKGETPFLARVFTLDPGCVVLISLAILTCWLPYIWLDRPFTMGPDTVAQILWLKNGWAFDPSQGTVLTGYIASDHHPFLDTLVYWAFYALGQALGRDTFGIALLAVVQCILLALSLGLLCCYMVSRLRLVWQAGCGCLAFFALMPCFGNIGMSIIKDTTSMPWFIVWVVLYLEMIVCAQEGRGLERRKFAALVAFGIVSSLMRKPIIYVETLSLLVALFCLKDFRRQVVAALAIPAVAVLVVVPGLVLPALHVAPAGAQEGMAVPLEQVAYVCTEGEEIEPKDREAIDKVLDIEVAKQVIQPDVSVDSLKDRAYKSDCTTGDRSAFMKVWLKYLLRYPGDYLAAVRYQLNYVKPGVLLMYTSQGIRWGWADYGGNDLFSEYAPYVPGEQPPRTGGQQTTLDVVGAFAAMPVVGFLAQSVTYCLILPLTSIILNLWHPNGRALVALMPLYASVLVLLVTPAAQNRYVYNCLFLAPLFLVMPVCRVLASQRVERDS